MPEPTPDEVREALARLLGYSPDSYPDGCWHGPGGEWLWRAGLPDPAADLNAMARVEAVLGERGLLREYVDALVVASNESAYSSASIDFAVTAPAAVRALAAYRTLLAARVITLSPDATLGPPVAT